MSLRTVGIFGVGLVMAVVVIAAAAGGLVSLVFAGSTLLSSDILPSSQAVSAIPAAYLQTFEAAAATCPGLPWTVLAGIGRVETDFGADTQTSSAGAVVIYGWDWAFRHARDGGRWARACEVSTRCEARRAAAAVVGRHTRSIRCLTYDGRLSGLACGVSE